MLLGIDAGNLLTEQSGKARYVQSVLAALSANGRVTVTLLCPTESVDVLAARYARSPIRVADEKTAKRTAYDLIWYPWSTVRFASESPKVATIHDLLAFTAASRSFFTRRREQKELRYTARETDEIIVSTFWARGQVSEQLDIDPESISVVSPTPDASWYPALDPLPFLELADMPYVLTVPGSRGPQNLDVLFEAFARTFKKREVRLVLCGDIPEKSLKHFDKLAHTRIVQPDDKQLRSLYRNAAAVAIPALCESFSFVAAEASACGSAIIAANSGALPECIGESSLLIDASNRKAWIDGLSEIIDDQALNARLRAQAVSNWSLGSRGAYVDQLLGVFLRVSGQQGNTTS